MKQSALKCVYLLQSLRDPNRRYIGSTDDVDQRVVEHNAGKSPHTAKYVPWKLVVAIRFDNDAKAHAFERYPKQGSGHAFARRHLW